MHTEIWEMMEKNKCDKDVNESNIKCSVMNESCSLPAVITYQLYLMSRCCFFSRTSFTGIISSLYVACIPQKHTYTWICHWCENIEWVVADDHNINAKSMPTLVLLTKCFSSSIFFLSSFETLDKTQTTSLHAMNIIVKLGAVVFV